MPKIYKEYTASVIAYKWKFLIIIDLLTKTKRYHELTIIPPKVEYSLTNKGYELIPILDLMKKIGAKYKQ